MRRSVAPPLRRHARAIVPRVGRRAARYAAGGGKRVRVGSPLPGFQNPFFPISFYIVRRFTTGVALLTEPIGCLIKS